MSREPQARAVEIHRRLAEQGYQGSYDLVKRRVRTLRLEALNPASGSAPGPGQRADADLDRVEAGGRTCFLFTLTLSHSRRVYAELLEKPDLDLFLDCHQRAFRFFQGVPKEVAYERTRNKWVKRLTGNGGFNLPLMRFSAHCGFTPCDAPPAAPWAAGRLKRPLRLVEAAFLRGYPLESLSAANGALLAWLLAREAVPSEGDRGPSIQERFAAERPLLGALPKTPWAKFTPKLAPGGMRVGNGDSHDGDVRLGSGAFPDRREAETAGIRRAAPPRAG
jgi:transposase